MRQSTLKHLDINEQIEAFFAGGGQVKSAPLGNALKDNDGESWREQNHRRYIARLEREAAK